jgi:hypothetical protein
MSIAAPELLVWLNQKATMIERVNDLAGLVIDGHLRIGSDLDAVISIAATATAPVPLCLPFSDS